jgi:hypothetical protein
MSYAPGAPRSIWAIMGLSDGAKLTVMHWWSKADHAVQQAPRRCTVWAPAAMNPDGSKMTPTESLLAELREQVHPGKADRTLRGHIKELADHGLAVVSGRCVDLVPPDLADPVRRKPAKTRRKIAGENPPETGEKSPDVGQVSPKPGDFSPSQLSPPYPSNISPEPPNVVEPDRPVVESTPARPTASEPTFSLTPPNADPPQKPDPVADVIKYFSGCVSEAREWAGLPKSKTSITITTEYRQLITGRMREIDGSESTKVEACKRVIDVQIHQAKSEGKCSPNKPDQDRLRATNGWKFLKLTTLFRNSSNFGKWLERWSEDGDHEVWGTTRAKATGGDWGRGSGIGSKATHSAAAEKLRREDAAAGIVHEPPTYFDEDDYEASCPTH